MKSRMIKCLIFFLLLSANAYAKPFVFGVTIEPISPTETVPGRKKSFEHFTKILSVQLKHPVELRVFIHTRDEIKALDEGKVDIALLKAVPYNLAKKENKKITGLVTLISMNDNVKEITHTGYIVTLRKKDINEISDLKDKNFGFIKHSASGLIYPIYYLEQNGIDYKSFFSNYRCYDNQYQLLNAIKNGEIDAGTSFRSPLSKHNTDMSDFKIISRISNIPNPLIAVSNHLSSAERIKLQTALLNLPDTAFRGVRFSGFKAIDEKMYQSAVEFTHANICKA